MVDPANGISLFLERMAPEGMVATTPEVWSTAGDGKKKVQWWGIDQNHPIPAGLTLVYDGEPAGHCMLTVTRQVTVKAFLALVAMIPFSKRQLDLFIPAAA